MERNGFKVDVDYLIKSHYKVEEFRNKLYAKLHALTESDWKVGQHAEIKKFLQVNSACTVSYPERSGFNNSLSFPAPHVPLTLRCRFF